jgi:23S rRNA (adenine2503-C2)-methyltransferase
MSASPLPSDSSPVPAPLAGHTSDELAAAAKVRLEAGAGVARALYRQAMLEGRFEPEAQGLGERAVRAWRAHFDFALPEVASVTSDEGEMGTTSKAVLRTADGLAYECVHIPMGRGRHTLCVSSQVGCKMGCRFCETGRMGLLRHLTPAEIVGQLLVARHRLGWSVRNVVFMGMGEALDNFAGLSQALAILTDPGGLSMAQERITVCTVGHVEGIRKLATLGYKRLNLSVSLNAANDAARSDLMPINRKVPLSELQGALAEFRPRRNFALGVNYCLMPGLNDAREDAADIGRFCRPLGRVLLNLIPYNPGNAPLTRAPSEDETERFIGWLREEGLAVRRRITKGRSAMAACGQLGDAELRRTVDVRSLRRP